MRERMASKERRMLVRAEGMECLLIESTEGKASKERRMLVRAGGMEC